MRFGFMIILFVFGIMRGNAQNIPSFTFHETPVKEVLEKIEQQTGYIFSYTPSILNPLVLKTISIKQASLEQVLNLVFFSQKANSRFPFFPLLPLVFPRLF